MMKILIPFLFVTLVYALPANNNAFDKAKVEDVEINSIHSGKYIEPIALDEPVIKRGQETTTPKLTFNVESSLNHRGPSLTITQPTGGSIVRIIDDIFQIPITVLQSVAKLLTGPFRQQTKSPEDSSKY